MTKEKIAGYLGWILCVPMAFIVGGLYGLWAYSGVHFFLYERMHDEVNAFGFAGLLYILIHVIALAGFLFIGTVEGYIPKFFR